ncbi:hypothetical protein [Photorhabdus hindustanensis]|uniref:Membrane transporter protein n=1 Tax=Photorhabdus hindustanensis TaxID=2918802 RepID=A0A2S8Q877_9GAMM|nr:hypothetical protein [Photorhabdus hindustanensis]PQQ29127.1 hypothetical protein C6H66_02270 [Photorhabdus hindustanensis]
MNILEPNLLIFILVTCAIFQSLVGVGLIMIGVPTLILMGFSFPEAHSLCLPGSLLINSFQVFEKRKKFNKMDFSFYLVMSIIFIISLIILNYMFNFRFNKTIAGIVLIFTGIFGLNASLRERVLFFIRDNAKGTSFLIGIIHALSSLGGSLLALSGSANYSTSDNVRKFIAGGYLILGCIQFVFFYINSIGVNTLLYSFISVPVYFITSRFLSPYVNGDKLKIFIFLLILVYGFLIL